MKVCNCPLQTQKNIQFKAGLNRNIIQTVEATDVNEVSHRLLKAGIKNDFQDDKVFEIIESFNKNYKTNFAYPKGVFSRDLSKDFGINDAVGFYSFTPLKLKSGDNCEGGTVFFDKLKSKIVGNELLNINKIAEIDCSKGYINSNHFLINFFHEFSHAIHQGHLQQKYLNVTVNKILQHWVSDDFSDKYMNKYAKTASKICDYALENPLEALSCDLSGRFANALDDNLEIKSDIFVNSPYKDKSLKSKIRDLFFIKFQNNDVDNLIKKIWDGRLI